MGRRSPGGPAGREHGGAWQGFKTYIARYLGDDSPSSRSRTSRRRSPSASSNAIAAHYIPALEQTHELDDRRRAGRRRQRRRRCDASTCASRATRFATVGAITPPPEDRVIDATGLVLAPGFIDVHNHSTDGLDSRSGGDHAGLAGHHDGARRAGWQLAVVDCATTSPRGARRPATVNVARARRARDDSPAGDGRRLPAAGDGSRDRAHVGARRAGDEGRRDRAVVRPRVRRRQLRRRPTRSWRWRASPRRHGGFYISHIRDEADTHARGRARGDRDRRAGQAAGADHAHQARDGGRVGQGRGGRGARRTRRAGAAST